MRKLIAVLVAASIWTLPLIAEEGLATNAEAQRESPQIAYTLFSNWADNYMADAKKSKTVSSGIAFGLGAVGFAGSALTWFGGDAISESATGSPMAADVKQGMTLGLGIGGGICLATGLIIALTPIKDYRAIYSDVFEEKDPEVREAMAVSVLRYQSDQGKQNRVSAAIWNIAGGLVASVTMASINSNSADEWGHQFLKYGPYYSMNIVSGVISLFTKSSEEQRYDRYLAARDAYYGTVK
jgi:hypothetical protein